MSQKGTKDSAGQVASRGVSLAFGLGWDMTYLFTYVGDKESELPDVPDRLPSLSRLPERKRSLIRLDRIRGPVNQFNTQFKAAGISNAPLIDPIEERLATGSSRDEIRDDLCELHYCLMRAFSTADNRLAKAYRLGRSLATTCHVANDEAALKEEFAPQRLARLDEWLADLASQLPPHSSRPVRLSLSAWQDWLADPWLDLAAMGENANVHLARLRRQQRGPLMRQLDWSRDGENVQFTLKRQGDIWRALLSGEKRGDAMLELPDFINAAMKVPRRTLRLLSVMVVPVIVSTVLICGGAALALSDDGVWREVIGFASIALGLFGAIGVTWQGTMETLRRSAADIKNPIWGAVLDEEIAHAITERPLGAVFEQEEAAKAAPAVGPVPVG